MREVLKLPAFRRLLAVSMLIQLGLSVGAVALAILVYRRTGSAFGAAAFFLCADFGPAFVSPFLVARLERRSAARSLAWLQVAQALLYGVLAWLVHRFALVPVLVIVLLAGSFALTALVLLRTAWTSLTAGSGLVREANALVNAGYSVCFMVGPALGGVLVALGGTIAALLVNVGVYVVGAFIVISVEGIALSVPDAGSQRGRLRGAIRYARTQPLIRRLLSLQAVGMLFFAISIPVEVVFVQHTLHGGAGGYGALLAAWGAGAIVGSLIYARWRRLSSRLLMTLGASLLGAGFLVMAVSPSLDVAIAGSVIGGVGNGVQLVAMRSAVQEAVSERWMALVLSLNQSLFQAVPGLGILLGGVLAASVGSRVALAVGAAGSLAVALLMWLGLRNAALAAPAAIAPVANRDLPRTVRR